MLEVLIFTATSFMIGLSGAMAPGPLLTVTISDSLKKGSKAGPLLVLGHVIGEVLLILLILEGFGWLITSSSASAWVGLIGGAVMIFMGLNMMRDTSPMMESDEFKDFGLVPKGLVTSVSNPYFFIWWGTIGAALMLKGMELAKLAGLAAFLIGHWSSDFVWYSIVSFFSAKGKVILKDSYKFIILACGIFLIVVGSYFILTSSITQLIS
ncbi:MAG TPA: LysE family transporter [Methanobacteriales archaeon]|nr:MAG: Lysine exporter protein (LYSE/YGGA) [Methanobacteriaceae archaeon 41_258]MBC7088829.1 LysE family transporter [Methanobacteriaceae archaeon]MBC7097101.1 LysE family transporter [Methanobacteriales archaeon]HIH62037.1 LysE family transporter [Methanobacteriales archaeon]